MSKRLLVPERGLENTRRNRQWLALVQYLSVSDAVVASCQEKIEKLAWSLLKVIEEA